MNRIVYACKEMMAEPCDGMVITNSYWCVHPSKGIAFFDSARKGSWDIERVSPQCNRDVNVAGMMQRKIYPDHTVEWIPAVFIGNLHKAIQQPEGTP